MMLKRSVKDPFPENDNALKYLVNRIDFIF